jgi:hypothetical protein
MRDEKEYKGHASSEIALKRRSFRLVAGSRRVVDE